MNLCKMSMFLASLIPSIVLAQNDIAQSSDNTASKPQQTVAQESKLPTNNTPKVMSPYEHLIKSYTYKVPFDGDFDKAYHQAFILLINEISKGGTSPDNINVDISSLITEENLGDDEIELTFGEEEVRKLFENGQIVVWNGLRDPLVVWMVMGTHVLEHIKPIVVDEQGLTPQTEFGASVNHNMAPQDVKIISSSSNIDLFSQKFIRKGQDIGVNLLYPMLDLDDIQNITVSDVMRGSVDKITKASARYSQGLATSIMLFCADNELRLIYHIINIASGKELDTGAITGNDEEIITAFYDKLRQALMAKPMSNPVMGIGNNDVVAVGFTDTSSLSLGVIDASHYQILVRNLKTFSDVVAVKTSLLTLGFTAVEIVDMKGADVVFNLTHGASEVPTERLALYPQLQLVSPEIYTSTGMVGEYIAPPTEETNNINDANNTQDLDNAGNEQKKLGVNNETPAQIQYNIDQQSTTEKNNNLNKNKYPDPNKKLRTGGGLTE